MSLAFDFDAGVVTPLKMQPGLRRMGVDAKHFHPIAPGSRHQREKLAVLLAKPLDALVCDTDFDPQPAVHALCARAAHEHPQHFSWDGHTARANSLGLGLHSDRVVVESEGVFGLGDELPRCVAAQPAAWRLAALLALSFAEDIVLLDLASQPRARWMSVCFPSRWNPRDKIGLNFMQLHASVPDADVMKKSGDHLLRYVGARAKSTAGKSFTAEAMADGGERFERFVWTVTNHARLHAHPNSLDLTPWGADVFGNRERPALWFRTERQSFLPLSELQQAAFLITIDAVPLHDAIDSATKASVLHAAVASMSDAVSDYRGLSMGRSALLAWLALRAQVQASDAVARGHG